MSKVLAAELAAIAAVLVIFASESIATHGMILESTLQIPRDLKAISGGSWGHVASASLEVFRRSAGLAVLGGVIALAIRPRGKPMTTDMVLLLWLMLELAEFVVLCLGSSGTWYNYALQAVICGAVLAGRGLAALDVSRARVLRLSFVALAVVLLAAHEARLTVKAVRARIEESNALEELLADDRVRASDRSERFFAQLPQYNRMYGRTDLIYDDWLYHSYETLEKVEPLGNWLEPELALGRVRLIVSPQRIGQNAPGLEATFEDLGYALEAKFGPYNVWQRIGPERDHAKRADRGPSSASAGRVVANRRR